MNKSCSSKTIAPTQRVQKNVYYSNFLPKINERKSKNIKARMIGSKIPLIKAKILQNQQAITEKDYINNSKTNQYKNKFIESIALTERVKSRMISFVKNIDPQTIKEQPYYLQGDYNFQQKINLIKRDKLKYSFKIKNAIDKFIETCFILETQDQQQFINKYHYMQTFFRIALILRSDLRTGKEKWPLARQLVERDWQRDLKGNIIMTKHMLANSLFELADQWTPEIDEDQYVEFFETLKVKYIMPIEEIGETPAKKISSFQMMF